MSTSPLTRSQRRAEFVRGFFLDLRERQIPSAVLHGGEDGFEGELSDVDFVSDEAGAKILEPVTICDNAVVGANAVVTKDVPAGATVVGGNRILSAKR